MFSVKKIGVFISFKSFFDLKTDWGPTKFDVIFPMQSSQFTNTLLSLRLFVPGVNIFGTQSSLHPENTAYLFSFNTIHSSYVRLRKYTLDIFASLS